ncbi:MAG: hypothetical protein Q4C63_00860 [Eubacteriales bacterium]|nr:hypothetical protein [Eubacteriales bacterium]
MEELRMDTNKETIMDLLKKVRRNEAFMSLLNTFKETTANYLLYDQPEPMEDDMMPACGYGGGSSFFGGSTMGRFVNDATEFVVLNQGLDKLIDPAVSAEDIGTRFKEILTAGGGSRKGVIRKQSNDYIDTILNADFIQDYL